MAIEAPCTVARNEAAVPAGPDRATNDYTAYGLRVRSALPPFLARCAGGPDRRAFAGVPHSDAAPGRDPGKCVPLRWAGRRPEEGR